MSGINYKPYEQNTLESLLGALNQGLDPSMGLQLFQGVQSGAQQRMAQTQALRQQSMATLGDSLTGMASANPNPAAGSTLLDSLAGSLPGLKAPMNNGKLDDLLQNVYPGGGTGPSPLFMDPNATPPADLSTLDPESIQGILKDATQAALGDVQSATPPLPLHDARMRMMLQLRAQGYAQSALDQAYDLIGQAYQSVGGNIGGAPLSTADKGAAPAPAQAPASGSPLSDWMQQLLAFRP